MKDDLKGIILWVGLAVICAVIYLISRRMKKQIEEDGIETAGVVSRIEDVGAEDIDLRYYVRYRVKDGEEIEGLLSNPGADLEVGQPIRIKYHPKHRTNARMVR